MTAAVEWAKSRLTDAEAAAMTKRDFARALGVEDRPHPGNAQI